jgi:hypothetical protein
MGGYAINSRQKNHLFQDRNQVYINPTNAYIRAVIAFVNISMIT